MYATEHPAGLVVQYRFAIVPEWLLDPDIGDAAARLYAVLLRYGQNSGARMPSRATLARRLHKKSTDTVDRALKALVGIGAVTIEHRYQSAQRLTNAYNLRTAQPGRVGPPTSTDGGSRTVAATPDKGPTSGRVDRAVVTAEPGEDPEHRTHRASSPHLRAERRNALSAAEGEVSTACGIDDWRALVGQIPWARREVGASSAQWAGAFLAAALQLAVRGRNWPADQAAVLRRVAANPESRSPMRVAEAGPWWDEPPTTHERPDSNGLNLRAMEMSLLEAGGVRIELQGRARRALEEAGTPGTRNAVIRGAYRLLLDRDAVAEDGAGGAA